MADVRVLGIDFGNTSIKIAAVRRGSGGYAARVLDLAPVPTREAMEEAERAAHIEQALQQLVERHGLKRQRCALSISGQDAAPRHFSFPHLEPDQIASAVRIDATEVIPFDIEDSLLDFHVFPPHDPTNPDEKTEGLFVAARREAVERSFDIATACGLEPVIVDTDVLALCNTFLEVGGGQPPDRPTMLVDIGWGNTNIAVLTPEGRTYVRDIFLGGNAMTHAIATSVGATPEDAERVKTGGVLGQPNTAENLQHLAPYQDQLLRSGLSDLIDQLLETLRFFVAQRYIEDINELWVTGGGAEFPGVTSFLQEELGVPAQGWNPLADISLAAVPAGRDPAFVDAAGPMFGVALGLAMRFDID